MYSSPGKKGKGGSQEVGKKNVMLYPPLIQKAALSLSPHLFFVPFLVPVTWQTELCVHA